MRKPIVSIVLAAILLLTLCVTPGKATSPPLDVNIVITTIFHDTGNSGPFIASGPAVDAGLICRTGIATDIFNQGSCFTCNRGANYLVLKQFVCEDNSGTFTLQINARVVFPVRDNGIWKVFSGTGAYEKLHGNGELHGDFIFVGEEVIGITDHISGKIY